MGSMRHAFDTAGALFGKARKDLLALFFGRPDESFYLRQLTRMLSMGNGAVQRELLNLENSGLIKRTSIGRNIYYSADRHSAVFHEIQSLLMKTSGLADVIRLALQPLSSKIKIAFIFGSMATGRQDQRSDVDVFMIGDATFDETVHVILDAQKVLGREINPVVFSLKEFREKLHSGYPFHRDLVDAKKVFIIGTEDEYRTLVEEQLD